MLKDFKTIFKNYQNLKKQQNITKNEIRIKYDESTQKTNFYPAKYLTPTEHVALLGSVIGSLVYQHCNYYENTEEEREEILKSLFKDIKEYFVVLDNEPNLPDFFKIK